MGIIEFYSIYFNHFARVDALHQLIWIYTVFNMWNRILKKLPAHAPTWVNVQNFQNPELSNLRS